MSRKSVRWAFQQFLSSPQLPGVGTVFASPPKIARDSDAYENLPSGTPSGSIVFVEILQVDEKRIATGGPTSGTKSSIYSVRLHVLFRSRQAKAEDAMDDHDDLVEAILQRLREDRTIGTLGSGGSQSIIGSIAAYGQDATGIRVSTGMPKTSGTGSTHVWTIIDGNCLEVFAA